MRTTGGADTRPNGYSTTTRVSGLVNVAGGTLRAGTIKKGIGDGSALVNWTAGTLRTPAGGDCTITNVRVMVSTAGAHILEADAGRTITLYSTVTGAVGVALQKTGAGTLKFGADNMFTNALDLTLSAGTLDPGGFSQTFGKLTLGGNATIDFGSGDGVLNFADSSSQTWTGTLLVRNWVGGDAGGGPDRLFVGSGAGGLTAAQLARFTTERGSVAAQLSSGEIVFRARGTVITVR